MSWAMSLTSGAHDEPGRRARCHWPIGFRRAEVQNIQHPDALTHWGQLIAPPDHMRHREASQFQARLHREQEDHASRPTCQGQCQFEF